VWLWTLRAILRGANSVYGPNQCLGAGLSGWGGQDVAPDCVGSNPWFVGHLSGVVGGSSAPGEGEPAWDSIWLRW
jgi:hypothetical protein